MRVMFVALFFSFSRCSVVALDIGLVCTFHIFLSLFSGLFHVLSCQGHFWRFPRPLQLAVALLPLFYYMSGQGCNRRGTQEAKTQSNKSNSCRGFQPAGRLFRGGRAAFRKLWPGLVRWLCHRSLVWRLERVREQSRAGSGLRSTGCVCRVAGAAGLPRQGSGCSLQFCCSPSQRHSLAPLGFFTWMVSRKDSAYPVSPSCTAQAASVPTGHSPHVLAEDSPVPRHWKR